MRVSGDDVIIGKTTMVPEEEMGDPDAPKRFIKRDSSSYLRCEICPFLYKILKKWL